MKFEKLHRQVTPLLISNVWDVPSAKTAEQLGFQAIGTSSSAIAAMLGYRDGEEMDFNELMFIVKHIARSTKLPLSVDLESGYSHEPTQIAEHIKQLAQLGVVGINLEDSTVDEKRTLVDATAFSSVLRQVKEKLQNDKVDIFINVRTDAFLLGYPDAISETQQRIQLYEKAGADGIFTPCIVKEEDISQIVACTSLPLNVMCMPDLPDFDVLASLGVKRISMGNFLFDQMYTQLENITASVLSQKSFKPIFQARL